jgi:hypothetical protein
MLLAIHYQHAAPQQLAYRITFCAPRELVAPGHHNFAAGFWSYENGRIKTR